MTARGRAFRPFDRRAELEKTHRIITECRPELLQATYEEATAEATKLEADAGVRRGGNNNPHGRKGKPEGEAKESTATVAVDSQTERAKSNGVSHYTQRMLDHLARDRPDLLEKVNDGEMRVKTAARAAGIVRDGYGLEPEEVALAVRWLKINDPDTPIGLPDVLTRATARERSQAAAEATTGEVLPTSGDRRSELSECNLHPERKASARAASAGVSVRTQRKLDRLARVAPEAMERVRAGAVSVHRACVEAGITQSPTTLDILRRAWSKATPDEKAQFRKEINPCPPRRRRPCYGRS